MDDENNTQYWAALDQLASEVPFVAMDPGDWDAFSSASEGKPEEKVSSLVRIGVSIEDLIRMTVRRTIDASKKCYSREIPRSATLRTYNPLLWQYRTTCNEKDSDPKGHIQHFLVLPQYDSMGKRGQQKLRDILGEEVRKLHCGVRCTCPAFVYWVSEFLSDRHGFALGKTPRGLIVPPRRNLFFRDGEPSSKSFLCKHLVKAAIDWMRKIVEVPVKRH